MLQRLKASLVIAACRRSYLVTTSLPRMPLGRHRGLEDPINLSYVTTGRAEGRMRSARSEYDSLTNFAYMLVVAGWT
jgi:hypothetical protein